MEEGSLEVFFGSGNPRGLTLNHSCYTMVIIIYGSQLVKPCPLDLAVKPLFPSNSGAPMSGDARRCATSRASFSIDPQN
jgi:hypothetical protein